MIPAGEGTSLADRKRRAGERLVVGIHGTSLTAETREILRTIRPAGVILFARNVDEPAQVAELNRSLAAHLPSGPPPILAVDQEGGRVQRIRATAWPDLRTVGRAGPDAARRFGAALGEELTAMGFTLNFAPVADVDSNPDNPVIGDRSFGRDPEAVGRAVAALVDGMQRAGIMACAKHFPGHGDTALDSHLALPTVDAPAERLEAVELPPFRAAVAAGVASMMTAHVVYPAWDPDRPATLSPAVQRDQLRRRLGFDGVLFSDDLEMKAVAHRFSTEEKIRGTLLATVDIGLACHDPALQVELYEMAVRLQERHRDLERLAVDSSRRLTALRARLAPAMAPLPDLSVVGSPRHRDLALALRAEGGERLG
jgi:beta-N-acetylhexosaminidase